MSGAVLPPDVVRVLRVAFGGAAFDDVGVMRGGRSGASVFSVRVGAQAFVVRAPDPARPLHVARAEREIACMALASARGIGPELRYADRETGITVSVRIDALGGRERMVAPGRLPRIAATLRALHDGPPLPSEGGIFDVLKTFDDTLRAAGHDGIPTELFRMVRAAAEAAARFGRRTPCHNDVNPGNLLETTERTYLVDWETAGWGDPFVDLAQAGIWGVSPEGREELLTAYLGHAPTARDRAHATVARVVALGAYAMSFTTIAVLGGEGRPDDARAAPLAEILPRLGQGTASHRDVAASLQRAATTEAQSDAYAAALRESTEVT